MSLLTYASDVEVQLDCTVWFGGVKGQVTAPATPLECSNQVFASINAFAERTCLRAEITGIGNTLPS